MPQKPPAKKHQIIRPTEVEDLTAEDYRALSEITEEIVESEGLELAPSAGQNVFPKNLVGEVTGASLDGGIEVKMIHAPDTLRAGTPLIIDTPQLLYYCLVTNLAFPINPVARAFANSPMTDLLPVDQVPGVRGSPFYAIADLNCLQILEAGGERRPFDTIPRLLSKARTAEQDDLEQVYAGTEHSGVVGYLNGIADLQVPINFQELVELPFGIFGATGSGKSVFTKILATWILHKRLASLLIFDMMSEYTWMSQEGTVPGLAQIFGQNRVATLALDYKKAPKGAEKFFLYKEDIKAGDLLTALSMQGLTQPQVNSIHIIYGELKKRVRKGGMYAGANNLLDAIMNLENDTKPEEVHAHTLAALKNRVKRFVNLSFFRNKKPLSGNAGPGAPGKPAKGPVKPDSFQRILDLFRDGHTIVLDFGRFGSDKSIYMFIANIIVRRLKSVYEENHEDYPQTVILLEEAHRFLASDVAKYSVFGVIARETRKYGLTLGLVDQRPSQIFSEVFSQLANRFILTMSDPKDLDAALSGAGDPAIWRGILRGLQKRQVVCMGSCITVPSIFTAWHFDPNTIKEKLGISKFGGEIAVEDVGDVFDEM